MRSIDATLLTNQKFHGGDPVVQLVIGTAPNTIDVSAYLLGYDYEEEDLENTGVSQAQLTLVLDNRAGYFNTLSGDKAYIAHGADVELKRGLTVTGSDYVEELPQCWVESFSYTYEAGVARFVIECIDWKGKLGHHQLTTAQSWSATSATTILEWILNEVGLSRLAGAMTALSLDFDIQLLDNAASALKRLVRKMPEYLYSGLDAEIKWKDIDSGDGSDYTFGWNASHPLLNIETGIGAWEINSVTVNGRSASTGSASDATQISAVGTRHQTFYDKDLDSNAECAQRAVAELDIYEADAVFATLVCRPCHGLELYDVITVDSPPWGGANTVGRVIRYREEWNQHGRWHQIIQLGSVPDKDPGNQPAKKKGRKGRCKRSRRRSRKSRRRTGAAPGEEPGTIPIAGIILWSGAIEDVPTGWALCDGNNGTPDLRNVFIVGAGDAYAVDDTGGADEVDISHAHAVGSLVNDTLGAHQHTISGNTGSVGTHRHASGGYATDNDTHAHTFNPIAGGTRPDQGVGVSRLSIINDTHSHDVTGNSGYAGGHSHTAGTLANDSQGDHVHTISGSVDTGGDATHDNRPAYYALAYIMRIE